MHGDAEHPDWDKFWTFYVAAETLSFTRASERLQLSQPTISRRISALEASLGCSLFQRQSHGLALTEQGETLYRTGKDIFARLTQVEAMIAETRERPEGLIRITTTQGFGGLWLASYLGEFRTLYPEIRIDLVLDDLELDLRMGEAHVAIRMRPSRQPDLIQRPILSSRSHIYAIRSYLARRGDLSGFNDLGDHDLIAYGHTRPPPTELLNSILTIGQPKNKGPRSAILTVNNTSAILHATLAGIGLAILPDFLADLYPELVRVLPQYEGPPMEGYFVYSEEMRHSKRISALRDFLLARLPSRRD